MRGEWCNFTTAAAAAGCIHAAVGFWGPVVWRGVVQEVLGFEAVPGEGM